MFNIKLIAGMFAFAIAASSGSFVYGSKKGYDTGYSKAKAECDVEKLRKQVEEYEVERQQMQSILDSTTVVVESMDRAAKRARQLDRKIEELNEQAVEFTSRPECNLTPDELRSIAEAYQVRDGSNSNPVRSPES